MNAWQAFRAIALLCAGVILGTFGDLTTRLSQREQARLEESVLRLRVRGVADRCSRVAIICDERMATVNQNDEEWMAANMVARYMRETRALIEECLEGGEPEPAPPIELKSAPAVEELPAPVTDLRA